ncbi:uncharacterized protein [Diadema antillarum]|uniref:uncharacterized protein n=1 Tax=Diadema antillarum TaxID=105358 RepID=UPI003A8B0199
MRGLRLLSPTYSNLCCSSSSHTDNVFSWRWLHLRWMTKTSFAFSASKKMSTSHVSVDFPLEPYIAPSWATHLRGVPSHKIKLAMLDTPIHRWRLPGTPDEFEVFIKRDDMTGSSLSGNKIRKLEFLLADAVSQGCDTVLTCGGVRSNHCRTTAVAARQLGMDCHLLLRSDTSNLNGSFTGNTLMDRMVGCHFYLIPKKSLYRTQIHPRMQQLAEYLGTTQGKKTYQIPIGGSNCVGVYGYIQCFEELIQQDVQDRFTDIVITTGSSGSLAGLAIGNYLTGSKLKIHGMAVCDDARYFHGEINLVLQELGIQGGHGSTQLRSENIVDVVEGVKGLGYGVSQPEELECIEQVARTTGIFVDPVYTGKATYHLIRLLQDEPQRFKGNKVLFVHTGGAYDVFSGTFESLMEAKSAEENKVYDWMELTDKTPLDH